MINITITYASLYPTYKYDCALVLYIVSIVNITDINHASLST